MNNHVDKIKSKFPKFISNDFPRKLLALFFALLVYFTVSYKIGDERRIQEIPVKISVPAVLVNMEETHPKVSLDVRASSRNLKQLTAAKFSIHIKLKETEYIPGEPYPVKILPQDVRAPIGVKVLKITPSEFLISLDRNVTREIKIKPRFEKGAELPEGYTTGNVTLEPSHVALSGPSRLVNMIKSLDTEPIPLDKSTTESFDYKIPVANKEGFIKIIPSKVTAQVEIVKEEEKRIFRSVPIKLLTANNGKEMVVELVSTPHVDVSVIGPKSKIQMMKANQLKAYADISSFDKPGAYNIDIGCWTSLPDVRIKNIYPSQVQVKLLSSASEKK